MRPDSSADSTDVSIFLSPDGTPAESHFTGRVITLLVDNSELDAELTAFALRPHPEIDLHHCARVEDAVTRALLVQPTVILLDLGLRERTDGLALISQFRSVKETHDIPIIVYSGWNDPRVISTAFKIGADDFLGKPADPMELTARVRYQSAKFRRHRQRLEMENQLHTSVELLAATNRALAESITALKSAGFS